MDETVRVEQVNDEGMCVEEVFNLEMKPELKTESGSFRGRAFPDRSRSRSNKHVLPDFEPKHVDKTMKRTLLLNQLTVRGLILHEDFYHARHYTRLKEQIKDIGSEDLFDDDDLS